MVCYNCRRDEIVLLKQSWREIYRVGQEEEALDVILVSCPTCLDYPHAHNPLKAALPMYLDVQLYSTIIKALGRKYKCTPTILEEKKFSLRTWKIKPFTRIRDVSEVVHPVTPPEAYITTFEKDEGFRFLRRPILHPHRLIHHPLTGSIPNDYSSASGILEDAPPPYITVGRIKEDSGIEKDIL